VQLFGERVYVAGNRFHLVGDHGESGSRFAGP
jgi:hypothetical protein